jgi:hypothetical protein
MLHKGKQKLMLNHSLAGTGRGSLPVDPFRIATFLGLEVSMSALEPGVSGALVTEPGKGAKILINRADSASRKRFTCAHEIGHYIRNAGRDVGYRTVDFRDELTGTGKYVGEVYANEFASTLLMPDNLVTRLREEGRFDWEIASELGVSREAVKRKLKNLGMA